MAQRTKMRKPHLSPIHLHNIEKADWHRLHAHTAVEGHRYEGAEVAAWDLAGITFSECELIGWSAHETDFRAARFAETRIERMDAPVFLCPRSTFRDVEISSSRLGSMDAYDSSITSVLVSDSKLGWINMRSSELSDVLFRNCTIDELDLMGANIERVAFDNCQVGSIAMDHAKFKNFDLRGLELDDLSGLENLKGVTIDSRQVATLARRFATHLGVTVED